MCDLKPYILLVKAHSPATSLEHSQFWELGNRTGLAELNSVLQTRVQGIYTPGSHVGWGEGELEWSWEAQ